MAVPLARSRLRWHQVLGNHDFDVQDGRKAQVPEKLGMPARYRDFEYGGFRFVILDTNDVSTYAYAAGTPERAEAERELARLQAANVRQAKPWNGGIGAKQLAWFEGICRDAAARGEKVIVLAHHPVYPDNEHNVWNADAVLAAVDRQPNVVAWLNGHNHKGGYGVRNGVGYLTLHGMVETADTNAFATVRVYPDRLVVTGHGREPERELRLRTG
jgi:3',5'-cyclic AMP phosphodiesterase CpdA